MFIIHRIVFFLNGLAILGLLLSYLAPYISPALVWQIAFLGLAYPVLLALNVLCAIYWIVFFKIRFLMSLVVIGIGYTHIPKYVRLNAKKILEKENAIDVVSFNMRTLGLYEDEKFQDEEKFLDIIKKANADLLCFQECKSIGAESYKTFYKQMKGYNLYAPKPNGQADGLLIFSHYPIVDSGIVEHDISSFNYTAFVDIKVDGKIIRVVNTHLQSIRFEEKEYKAVKQFNKIENDTVISGYKSIAHKLKTAFMQRAKQAEAIREFIVASPHPVIVCGDFNDSPTSYAYNLVKGEMQDAFMEAASGLGRTYVGTAPSLRIDYIFYHNSFQAFNYAARTFDFSDHKMISCRLKLK